MFFGGPRYTTSNTQYQDNPMDLFPTPSSTFEYRYDTKGNGEMTIGELSSAMAKTAGLTKEDVVPMFSQTNKAEEVGLCFLR